MQSLNKDCIALLSADISYTLVVLPLYKMTDIGGIATSARVCAVFAGVAQCEEIPRRSWITKCVILRDEAGRDVAKGIFHNVSAVLVIVSDNQPLGDDRGTVQIAESLSEVAVPSDWMFQLQSWPIHRVFLNGASLLNHEQMNLFNLASRASCHRSWIGAWSYESSREQRNPNKVPKKEALLIMESIAFFLKSLTA